MGTKRDLKETKTGAEVLKPNKRVKSNRHGSESEAEGSTHGFQSNIDESMLVQQLKAIVDQVVDHPQVLQNYPGGSEILKVTTQLRASLSENHKKSKNPPTKLEARWASSSSLPDLPSIPDPSLEKAVFIHPGTPTNIASQGQEVNYDRLEVLGDAYLEVIATRLIWDHFKDIPAGRMCQIREDLIKNETLAGFASQYGFDRRVTAPDDHRSQPKRWLKLRGDVFEAYVAAVILSNPTNGFKLAEQWLRKLWLPRLAHVHPVQPVLRDKEQLAKKVMSKGIKLKYVEERPPEQLDGGKQTFYIGVYLTGWGWHDQHLGSGSGLNKAIAGNEAANSALHNSPLIDRVVAAKAAHDRGS